MPDDTPDTPEDVTDDTPFDEIDDGQFDDLRAALGELAFLDPVSAFASDPMPDDVWSGLQASLASEAAHRAAAEHPNVVVLTPSHRPSRSMRWAGGLVAASVAIVAVGLAVGTIRGGSQDQAVVAGGALAPSSADQRSSTAAAAPEAAAEDVTTAVTATVPAARIVMASNTNYLPEKLPGQVVALVKNAGFATPEDAQAKIVPPAAMPVETGFTASWEALRACLTWLTQSGDIQALIVDRATYDGSDAGVIVAPASIPDAEAQTPSPSVTIATDYGAFDVWVVNPDCKKVENALDDFPLYEWKP